MSDLLIMRHGKTLALPGVPDREQPLHDRGKRAAQRLGIWLWQQDLRPDLIVTSPVESAHVSAEKCCKAMDLSPARIRMDERLVGSDVHAMLDVLHERAEEAGRLMLVGHKPGCDALLRHLCVPDRKLPASGKLLRRGALAHVQTESALSRVDLQSCVLRQIVNGRKLPKKFPYPAPHGTEGRARPAYYYTQSGVIPYRVRRNRFEVLVVRSSKRNHWVVPKGVSGPGQTLQESAAEEALEEAGVRGEVQDVQLGDYSIEKWGATCRVVMFALQVTEVLRDEEWEEQHRGREWLAVEAAAERVAQPELKDMILMLPRQLGC